MKGFSQKELDRANLLKQIENGKLTQIEAAGMLGISDRQVRRIIVRFCEQGVLGLKRVQVISKRKFHDTYRKKVTKLIESKYAGFGPTLACEMLLERDDLKINKETIRQWMIAGELWKGKRRKGCNIHQSRERRPCFGELVQIDGSVHDWFEGRSAKCCCL